MRCDAVTRGEVWSLPRKALPPDYKILQSTTDYSVPNSVLQSITPYYKVLFRTKEYIYSIQSATPYFKVLQ